MSEKLTDWFPGTLCPARNGVYKLFEGYYARFEAGQWMATSVSISSAAATQNLSIWSDPKERSTPDWQWRGLAQDPSAKQKKGKK